MSKKMTDEKKKIAFISCQMNTEEEEEMTYAYACLDWPSKP